MKRRVSVPVLLALLILAVLTTYLITNTVVENRYKEELSAIDQSRTDFQKLAAVDRIVRENYVAGVDETLTSEGSISGYLASLNDPRSYYLDRGAYETYKALREQKTGFCGITLGYDESENRAIVLRVCPGSSAETSGILPGDLILSVNGHTGEDVEFEAFDTAMQGTVGEKVRIAYRRGEEVFSATLEYTLSGRGSLSGRMCFTQAAYLVFDDFSKDCSGALRDRVNALIEQGADLLIFDMRGVESVGFEEAVKCAGVIAGNVELARRITSGGASETITGDTTPIPLPCAVLIDEETSGAGELFAAVLRDTRGAIVIGSQSAGNASVQALIELSDQSAIKLTTKLYLPPVSDSFDQKGVEPDLVVRQAQYRAANETDDPALKAAYDYLNPRHSGKTLSET